MVHPGFLLLIGAAPLSAVAPDLTKADGGGIDAAGNMKTLHSPQFGKICIYSADAITEDVLEQCAELFSAHYGKWGQMGPKPGQRVKLSAGRLRRDYLFDNKTCFLVTAESKKGSKLIGHAFACRFPLLNGFAVWITQLVVHCDFRNHGFATELLSKCCLTKDNIAWGIVSSHPHAIRALERVTKRKCEPEKIAAVGPAALIQRSGIPYMQNCTTEIRPGQSLIHTNFFVDHTEANELRSQYEKTGEWHLGHLNDGDEFFAFTFEF